MNEQQQRERFHRAVDSTLSGLQGDPFLYQRVIAQREKGDISVKKHPKWSAGLVLALIGIISMLTVAAASGVLHSQVNWQGREELPPMATVMPTPMPSVLPQQPTDEQIMNERMCTLLNSCPDGERMKVTWVKNENDVDAIQNKLMRHFQGQKGQDALLMNLAPLPSLRQVPDGYFLISGYATYDCRDTGTYTLLSTETVDGLTVERYGLSDSDAFISACAWNLFPENGEVRGLGDFISVSASLEENNVLAHHTFGIWDGEDAQTIEVPGMTDALLITSDAKVELFMHRPLEEPIGYFDPQTGMNRQYDAVYINIYAPAGTEVDALLGILDIR